MSLRSRIWRINGKQQCSQDNLQIYLRPFLKDLMDTYTFNVMEKKVEAQQLHTLIGSGFPAKWPTLFVRFNKYQSADTVVYRASIHVARLPLHVNALVVLFPKVLNGQLVALFGKSICWFFSEPITEIQD